MKIEKELLEDHQIKLHVEFEAEQFESAKRRAARKIAKKVKIPGFRPGKAPYHVVLRQVGEGAIVEEALDVFIDEAYPKVLEEAEVDPYGPGRLENVETLEPPTFEFLVPLAPQVELGDYKALNIAYEIPAVEAEEIETQLDELRKQQSLTETSEEPAKEGDRVFFRVSADRAEVEEGQEAEIIPERFNSAIIETEEDEVQNQWPFPGFSANLKGMSIDDEKDIIYTYPEDHENEDLQGVEAVFHVIVTNVQTVTLPELDDEFAKAASDFDTFEELSADIEAELQSQKEQEYASEYDNLVLDTLVEESTIKYPPQMVEDEKEEMISNLEYRLSQQGISRELYLQIRNISEEEFIDEIIPVAEERIKRGLVLGEIARAEDLQLDQEQLAAETGRTVDIVTRGMTPKEAKDFQKSKNVINLVNNIMSNMITQKSIEYLRAIAKGEPWPPEEELEAEENEETVEAPASEAVSDDDKEAADAVADPETMDEMSTPEAKKTSAAAEPASEEQPAEEAIKSE